MTTSPSQHPRKTCGSLGSACDVMGDDGGGGPGVGTTTLGGAPGVGCATSRAFKAAAAAAAAATAGSRVCGAGATCWAADGVAVGTGAICSVPPSRSCALEEGTERGEKLGIGAGFCDWVCGISRLVCAEAGTARPSTRRTTSQGLTRIISELQIKHTPRPAGSLDR